MLFYILLFAPVVAIVGGLVLSLLIRDVGPFLCSFAVAFLIGLFTTSQALYTWGEHVSDISKVVAQDARIEVYTNRIEALNQRLAQFPYPEKSDISLDADTPWGSMVKSLTEAESELAFVLDERAVAIRSIEARKRGPMSGVVSFVGDYQ